MTARILYLVHDLYDPAVHKRVNMLKAGKAEVTIAGFRRAAQEVYNISGFNTINFGQTYNAGFAQRLFSVIKEVILINKYQKIFSENEIIIARNLEMLAIAVRGRSICKNKPVLVYESLDIHRLLLRKDMAGKLLRWLEGWLSKHASLLITSSPAFIREYFEKISEVKLPTRLIENKVFPTEEIPIIDYSSIPPKPWKIGWFGVIRCHKSLDILSDLIRSSNGNVEVIIRGRPALDQFTDFHESVNSVEGIKFLGEYKADDLAKIYSEVHFTWSIDMYEENLNSSWLLPNRLYEGCLYGSVPIAIENVETGRFINALGIGVCIKEPKNEFLFNFFNALTIERYCHMKKNLVEISNNSWAHNINFCEELVTHLRTLR
jgi:succinoglycan biosynthesis protein ExoL